MPFAVREEDWLVAERYLSGKPSGTKLSRKEQNEEGYRCNHSFIIIDEVIYAFARTSLGRGSYSKVKLCQTRAQECYAIKIQNAPDMRQNPHAQHEQRIESDLGLFVSSAKRTDSAKTVRIIKYLGMNLTDYLNQHKQNLKISTILNIYIQCLKEVNALHTGAKSQGGIKYLHRDIKWGNFVIDSEGKVSLIDFGFSCVLTEETDPTPRAMIILGTSGYRAPEINRSATYSIQSEIYALGILLKAIASTIAQLRDNDTINALSDAMTQNQPSFRPAINDIIARFDASIESITFEETIDRLRLLPEQQRLKAITRGTHAGNSLIYSVIDDINKLKIVLSLLPENERLRALKYKNQDGDRAILIALYPTQKITATLRLLPEQQRLEAVSTPNEFGETVMSSSRHDIHRLRRVIEQLPLQDRSSALEYTNERGHRASHLSFYPTQDIIVMLDLLEKNDRLAAFTLTQCNRPFDYEQLQSTLKRMPISARLSALQHINRCDAIVFEQVINALELLLPEHRLQGMEHMSTFCSDVEGHSINHLKNLKTTLALFPKNQRIEALKHINIRALQNHETELNGRELKEILRLFPATERKELGSYLHPEDTGAVPAADRSPDLGHRQLSIFAGLPHQNSALSQSSPHTIQRPHALSAEKQEKHPSSNFLYLHRQLAAASFIVIVIAFLAFAYVDCVGLQKDEDNYLPRLP